jgi:uncharacterized protein YeaO (DUF488 family)
MPEATGRAVGIGDVRIKRAHEPPSPDDGCRVLVDRIWPRGLSKAALRLDARLPAIAPSDGLRRWFGHDPDKWDKYRERYFAELRRHPGVLAEIREAGTTGRATRARVR